MNTKIKWQTSNNFVCQNHFNLDLYTYNIMAAPIITVFKNGDVYFPGKKLVINPKEIRNFDALLDKITSVTKAKVAVRSIRTPSHGHRVNSVTRLENGGVYVAVGCERFKKLEYKEIRDLPGNHNKPPEQTIIRPVHHSRVVVSGRARKVAAAHPLANRIIHVYRNGDERHPSFKLLLDKRILCSMDQVLNFITDKVNLQTGAVRCLYTMDGIEVREIPQIENGQKYVAVGYGKRFLKMAYNDRGSVSITPRRITIKSQSTSSDSAPKKPPYSRQTKSQPPTFARQNRATKYKDNTEQHISDRPGKRKQKRKSVDKEEYIERNQTENSTDSNFDEDLNRRIKGIDEPHENTSPSNNDTQPTIDNINSRDSRQSRKISKPDSIKSSRNNSLTDNNYNNNDSETTERQTAEQRKRSTEIEVKNAKQTEEAEDVEDTDAVHPSSAGVFKATGQQSESANAVKENKETKVEKTIDMLPAEEVEEELDVFQENDTQGQPADSNQDQDRDQNQNQEQTLSN